MPDPRLLALTLAALIVMSGCGDEGADQATQPAPESSTAGTALFGLPGPSTGLDENLCRPERLLPDGEPFTPPAYDAAQIEALRSRVLVDPPALLPGDPYADPSLVPADPSGVCAVLAEPEVLGGYSLRTFPDKTAARAAGGVPTHGGACGACSSLQDLAVYLSDPDLGEAVRRCALRSLGGNDEAARECIVGLGFSEPCAQIWAFNSANTRAACLEVCLAVLEDPYHLPDGSLNPCLTCDEEQSGPVFKAVAGRTRRNSGIPVAICRPPEDVTAIRHDAYP